MRSLTTFGAWNRLANNLLEQAGVYVCWLDGYSVGWLVCLFVCLFVCVCVCLSLCLQEA